MLLRNMGGWRFSGPIKVRVELDDVGAVKLAGAGELVAVGFGEAAHGEGSEVVRFDENLESTLAVAMSQSTSEKLQADV